MQLDVQGVTAIATVVSALVSCAALWSIIEIRNQMKRDHDRSRRERAGELMLAFVEGQNPTNHQMTFAIELLHGLTADQNTSLQNREPFTVTKNQLPALMLFRTALGSDLANGKSESQSGNGDALLSLSLSETLALRKIATSHLNRLELIASMWANQIADQKIIEEEFINVFQPRNGVYVLEAFRSASGIYPSISMICKRYQEKKNPSSPRHPSG